MSDPNESPVDRDDDLLTPDPGVELPPVEHPAVEALPTVETPPLPPPPPAAGAGAAPATRLGGVLFGRLAWGLVLLVLGGVLLLERLGMFYLDEYFRWWPFLVISGVLVTLGVLSLVSARANEQRRSALWLLALGGWFLLNALELFGFWFHNSWPLIILATGVIGLLYPKPGEARANAFWPLAIGGWLLINTLGLWGFTWGDSWPLLLILLGASLVVGALFGTGRRRGHRSGGVGGQ